MMRLTSVPRLALAAVAALAVTACGSDSNGTGRINVRLVDGPAVAFKHIMLDVQRVEIGRGGGWEVIGTPNKTVDLLTLVNGVSADLVTDRGIAPGRYSQLRLVLGPNNQIETADGTIAPLTVPSGMQSGIKVNVDFDVAEDQTTDVYIDMDAKQSIFVHQTGNSAKYILRPVMTAVADAVGTISGTLVAADSAIPPASPPIVLPFVTVMAQKIGADGKPVIVRTTRTNAAGFYQLDLLRMDGTQYFVVAQPVVTTTTTDVPPVTTTDAVYEAAVSEPIVLTPSAATATWDHAFVEATTVGSIAGTITPPPTEAEADWLSIAQAFTPGGQAFIVRREPVSVADALGSYAVGDLPAPADYSAWITRSRIDGFGDETTLSTDVTSFTVAGGAPTPVNFAP